MKDYKQLLIERHRKAQEAAPLEPEKPLTHIQHQNHQNLRAWRERLFVHKMTKSWIDK